MRRLRLGPVLLAAAFGVFNVGLPVVVASCPLAGTTMGRASCCSHYTQPASERFERLAGRPCCKTSVAAERNTSEFVQSVTALDNPMKATPMTGCAVTLHSSLDLAPSLEIDARGESPPLRSADIPIFTSTLLI